MTPKQIKALQNLRKLPLESRKKVARQILQLIALWQKNFDLETKLQ